MTTEQAREEVDHALCEWVKTLGFRPEDFDFSYINETLDDIEALI